MACPQDRGRPVPSEMPNPYASSPDTAFWSRAVARAPDGVVDPVVDVPFRITPADPVATAGSCFAQHISRHLRSRGFCYLQAEDSVGEDPHGYGLFSARYGNVYTVRQLLQLIDRTYGLFDPRHGVWVRADGRFVDAFRPRILAEGSASAAEVAAARDAHLLAVRRVLEDCSVFVFTLGLTEAWVDDADGAVFPLAPGVVAEPPEGAGIRFHNFSIDEVRADLALVIEGLRAVNPDVRVVLTVSPVPLIATGTAKHVLPATVYSKSVLRVAAEEAAGRFEGVAYFPSYEIITGPQARGRTFAADLRTVTDQGVATAMSVFERHFLTTETQARPKLAGEMPVRPATAPGRTIASVSEELDPELAATLRVICDEEEIERSLGA
ncbi:GSCFA domain-containing protein [Muricoccus radiodurans]|uniref:GSCFA domain-containing protein n=1 Tax=Muricoccus radiodurans TaxID=2231721 RepID=UPI003CEC32DF